MGLFDSVKKFISDSDDDFDDYYQEEELGSPAAPVRERSFDEAPERRSRSYEREESLSERIPRRSKSDKVVNIHATTQYQVVLVKPERFDEAKGIADHLNEKRTVVLNLEATSKDIARRFLDFLTGVAYANNGQIKKVANSTYIITPYNVDVMGDLIDELESNGMFMKF
ncbi:MAG: cell division protein SepF [Eubacterium sp.]|nr:cell division protein SepF [Eubacterium sp.]